MIAAFTTSVRAFAVLVLIGTLAMGTGQPFLFPSLGPTAFLLFATPLQPTACPRNTLLGHLVGVLSGAAGLATFGLLDTPPDLTHVTWARAGAAALALALTCGGMVLLRLPHPPAGATTLIIALGLLRTPADLLVVLASVVLLSALGFAVNRLARIPYPVWKPQAPVAPVTQGATDQ
ncbi:HPP family protein [Amycolatopsis suaedae]|uniref:HPP family protein n=1 Tax=Amycolatopsis suaedae TaxID=2510978 RepID=A0A4Q7J911_9PSEU|nr:HPP family protein [Amycolatopsis suaedae]RZQ63362.1 HPP family protein [Amycolatopsis suaedae]